MPKRCAEEKLAYYKRKVKKIQEQERKKKRRILSSESSDSEKIEENSYVEHYEVMVDESSEQPTEISESQLEEIQSVPPLPPTPLSDPVEPKDTQTTSVPSTEDPPEPPLNPELLSALGACTSDFGDSIHSSLANLWLPILRKGLSKEDKEGLTKEYLIPSNCKLLQAPKLNAEISAAVSEIVRGRDRKIANFQQELGAGVSAVNRGMDILLKTDNKALALKNLSDGCRLLSDLHYCLTKDRTKHLARHSGY